MIRRSLNVFGLWLVKKSGLPLKVKDDKGRVVVFVDFKNEMIEINKDNVDVAEM